MELRRPDYLAFYYEGGREEFTGAAVTEEICAAEGKIWLEEEEGALTVSATAHRVGARYLKLRWNEEMPVDVKILGDAYERGYGDLQWQTIRPERAMPWYMAASNGSDSNRDYTGRRTDCFGVRVQPNAMCFWQYDAHGVTLWLDIRNGGRPCFLAGRRLACATVLFASYSGCSAYAALADFCHRLSPAPYLPTHKVYGSNNWYYAYGKSSAEEIVADATLLASLCRGLENRPYMVIDDGWQENLTDAPWTRGNEKFPDMRGLSDALRAAGTRPGIWIRYLINGRKGERVMPLPDEWHFAHRKNILDPSHPAVLAYVGSLTEMLTREWGFELIKHDFSTFDIFGRGGAQMPILAAEGDWGFYDRGKTTAEIVKNFYRTVKEHANGAVIIGCNTIGHLCAGLHQLNRTGDDTSGREWSRTVKMGVNTLAFRNCQNGAFYMCDADCVGITEAIPWEENRAWLAAAAQSGSPLFVSCKPGVPDETASAELREAFRLASLAADELVPLDWMETTIPERYLINGEEVRFRWFTPRGDEWVADAIAP